tara:strand:- start:418 stop:735 length:318 start_codon:yes stop_codon:yes gene_type:complete
MTKRPRMTQDRIDLVRALLDQEVPKVKIGEALKISGTTINHIIKANYDLSEYNKTPRNSTSKLSNDVIKEKLDEIDEIVKGLQKCLNMLTKLTEKPENLRQESFL